MRKSVRLRTPSTLSENPLFLRITGGSSSSFNSSTSITQSYASPIPFWIAGIASFLCVTTDNKCTSGLRKCSQYFVLFCTHPVIVTDDLQFLPVFCVRYDLSPDICNCLFDLSDLFFQFFFLLCRNLLCRYNRS